MGDDPMGETGEAPVRAEVSDEELARIEVRYAEKMAAGWEPAKVIALPPSMGG